MMCRWDVEAGSGPSEIFALAPGCVAVVARSELEKRDDVTAHTLSLSGNKLRLGHDGIVTTKGQ